jgi:hypothetical protein
MENREREGKRDRGTQRQSGTLVFLLVCIYFPILVYFILLDQAHSRFTYKRYYAFNGLMFRV